MLTECAGLLLGEPVGLADNDGHLLIDNDSRDRVEHFIHVQAVLRRGLEELQAVLVSERLAALLLNDSISAVTLVGHEDLGHVRIRVLVNLLQPVGDVVERLLVRAIVDQDDPHGPFVVGLRDRAEALLARRVPDLQLDPLVVDVNLLDFEVNACASQQGESAYL